MESVQAIREAQKLALKKINSSTVQARNRKIRIINKLILNRKKVSIICSIYESVLSIFKNFVMVFQSAESMIHLIHPSLEVLMRSFYSHFLQLHVLRSSTSDDLINIDLQSNKVPPKYIFLGKARTVINNKRKVDKDFQEKLLRSYLDTAEYMQKKLPLKNQNIKEFSCIDPRKILNDDEDNSRFNLSV